MSAHSAVVAGVLLLATPWAVIGFALVGLGVANVIPLLFSAAGRAYPTA